MPTRPKVSMFIWAVLFAVAIPVSFNAATRIPDSFQTIVGTVVVVDEDAEGEVTQVAISVETETEDPNSEESYTTTIEDYLVADTEIGRELLELEGKEVEATGEIEVQKDGTRTIAVSAYKIIETPEDPESPEEPEED